MNDTNSIRQICAHALVAAVMVAACATTDADDTGSDPETTAGPTTATTTQAESSSGVGSSGSSDGSGQGSSSGTDTGGSSDGADSSTGDVVCGDPAELGIFVPSDGSARGFEVVGDTVYLALQDAGIAIVDVGDPAAPTEVGALDLEPGQLVHRIAVGDGVVFAGLRGAGWSVIDVSDPTMPAAIFHEPDVSGQDLAFADGVLYVADVNGVQVFDVADPAMPVPLVQDLVLPGSTQSVVVAGEFAYAAGLTVGLSVIDISDPAAAFEVTTLDLDGRGYLTVVGDRAFVSATDGVHIVDVADPTQPVELGVYQGERLEAVAADDRLWILGSDTQTQSAPTLSVVDVTDPAAPIAVSTVFDAFATPSWIEVADGRVFFTEEDDDALHILDGCP